MHSRIRTRTVSRPRVPLVHTFLLLSILLTTAALPGGVSAEAVEASSNSAGLDAAAAFERLKGLVGAWKGTWSPGDAETTVTYRLTGNGSAVVEDYKVGETTTMATLYHLDGDELMLTHYCSAGNQPRMRATALGADSVEFDFVDVTNHTRGGYSKRLVVSWLGADRISLTYVGSRTGKPSGVELERVR